MKLARYMSLVALAMAVALLMAVVPSAPKSASAQGPATRYECNYVTMSSKIKELSPLNSNPTSTATGTQTTTNIGTPNSTGSQSGVTGVGTGASGTPTGVGTNSPATGVAVVQTNDRNRCETANVSTTAGDLCFLAASLSADIAAYETYVNKDVLFSISGTGSFSGIANRRQLKGRVTSFVIEGDASAVGTTAAPIKTRHVVEFDNYSNQDGVCASNEMCFVALGEGAIIDYSKNTLQGYDQLTDNLDNLNISIAVVGGNQQLRGLCGRLSNSRNNTTSQTVGGGDFAPDATPENAQTQSRSEMSKLNGTSLVFNMAGALCECQTNKSGPSDYGVQNNQGQ